MNTKIKRWLLGTACSVFLAASSCSEVKHYYKENFGTELSDPDGSHADLEKNRKVPPREPGKMGNQDSRTATTSSPFSLKWSW